MAKYPHLEMNLEPHMTVNTLTATENNYMTATRNRLKKQHKTCKFLLPRSCKWWVTQFSLQHKRFFDAVKIYFEITTTPWTFFWASGCTVARRKRLKSVNSTTLNIRTLDGMVLKLTSLDVISKHFVMPSYRHEKVY